MMPSYLLYIDPGTGSMLVSLAIGLATAGVFAVRALAVKLRFILSGGKTDKINASKIPYVIFSDHKRYWNVFKPFCDEFERQKIPLTYYTQSPDDPALAEHYQYVTTECIGEGNKGFLRMNMLNAGVVVATTPELDVLQWKRSKNVDYYIHVPHSIDELSAYRMFALDYYDGLLASNQLQVDMLREFERLRPAIKRRDNPIVGSPHMDGAWKKVQQLPPHTVDFESPTVLLAPSWGKNTILNRYGEKLIDALLATGFKIIIRPHPQSYTADKEMMDRLLAKYPDVEWNRDNDNLAVLNRADMLITDFSTIIFDWVLLFDRPCIYAEAEFDISCLDSAWLEDPDTWMFKAIRRIGIKLQESQFPEMRNVILNALRDTSLAAERKAVKEECWYNQGNAAKDAVDYLLTIPL